MTQYMHKETEEFENIFRNNLKKRFSFDSEIKDINALIRNFNTFWNNKSITNVTEELLVDFYNGLPQKYKIHRTGFVIFLSCLNELGYGIELSKFAQEIYKHSVRMDFPEVVNLKPRNRYYIASDINDIGICYIYIDSDVTEIRELIVNELRRTTSNVTRRKLFCQEFNESLKPYIVDHITDLSYDTFVTQIIYFAQKEDPGSCWSFLREFYITVDKTYNLNIFKPYHIDDYLLTRTRFIKEISEGYKVIFHSRWEKYPVHDKWLMVHNNSSNGSIRASNTTGFNFEKIPTIYRDVVKQYIWNAEVGYVTLSGYFEHIVRFFSFIESIENGSYVSIYCTKPEPNFLNTNKILAFKNEVVNQYGYGNTSSNIICSIKTFLLYGATIDARKWDKSICFGLEGLTTIDNNSAKALSQDEIQQLSNVVNNNRNTDEDELCAIVYYLLITTELRISNILALTRNSISETMKNNQYVIKSKTKTSGNNNIDIPITIDVATLSA